MFQIKSCLGKSRKFHTRKNPHWTVQGAFWKRRSRNLQPQHFFLDSYRNSLRTSGVFWGRHVIGWISLHVLASVSVIVNVTISDWFTGRLHFEQILLDIFCVSPDVINHWKNRFLSYRFSEGISDEAMRYNATK